MSFYSKNIRVIEDENATKMLRIYGSLCNVGRKHDKDNSECHLKKVIKYYLKTGANRIRGVIGSKNIVRILEISQITNEIKFIDFDLETNANMFGKGAGWDEEKQQHYIEI